MHAYLNRRERRMALRIETDARRVPAASSAPRPPR